MSAGRRILFRPGGEIFKGVQDSETVGVGLDRNPPGDLQALPGAAAAENVRADRLSVGADAPALVGREEIRDEVFARKGGARLQPCDDFSERHRLQYRHPAQA